MPLVRASVINGVSFYLPVFFLSIERFMQPCWRYSGTPIASLNESDKTGFDWRKLTLT